MPRTTFSSRLARYPTFILQTHQGPCTLLTQECANKHNYTGHRSSPTPSLSVSAVLRQIWKINKRQAKRPHSWPSLAQTS